MKKENNSALHNVISGKRTKGERAADAIATYAGSWTFIILFLVFLAIWMSINIYAWSNAWDPYPFILLNLILSCVAALQAPIILMSQNRQSQKDRKKMEYDYHVNRVASRRIEQILASLDKIERRLSSKRSPKTYSQ